ncbi:trypsin-like [Chironomus tepperi]|uniref:trypsin-like n=1 Tax=Chironomus tepperi TaxID=113505 RepID=UPI00391FA8B0
MIFELTEVNKAPQHYSATNDRKLNYSFTWKQVFINISFYIGIVSFIVSFTYLFILAINAYIDSNTPIKDTPYLAKLIYSNGVESGSGCTAFLIKNSILLSAAHCLMLNNNATITAVHIGGTKERNYEDMLKIPGTQLHFKSDYDLEDSDFAVINLEYPIIPTDAVRPLSIAPRGSSIPKKLIFNEWSDDSIDNMDSVQVTVSVIDLLDCLISYRNININLNIYGSNYKYKRPIFFCTDGGYIRAGNSGTPIIATDSDGYAYGLLSKGPTESYSVPNIFVDLRTFIDEIDEDEGIAS